MSRGSQRSLVTSRGGDKSSNSNNNGGGGSNTKCIITVGIILPLLAAIIGVAAWSVSSDSHRRSPTTTVYHIGRPAYRNGDNIFEERNDEDDLIFGQKVPIGGAVSKDVLGPDVEDERDILPPATEAPAQNDPLYVVHYVPRGHQEATSAPPVPSPAPDVLSKILQSGKGTGKGTPQFVVFAPMANEEDNVDDRSMDISRKRTRKRKKPRKDYDYEDEEYPAHSQVKPQKVPAVPRNGYFDSNVEGQGWAPQNQNQPHVPCCNGQGGQGGGGYMSTTAAPNNGGITITLGQGLPLGPLGILRQILRPKVDLKKKMFFGIQLENGIGFGGNNNGGNTQMGGGGQMNQGHMGGMGGGMGQQGGGGGGGITYTFG